MDGTANEWLVKKVLGENIIYEEINVEKNPNVIVEQHTYHPYSKNYLNGKTLNQVVIHLEKFIDGYKNIGLITYQAHTIHNYFLDDVATGMGANVTAYFGNVRGDNNFIDCDLLMVLGRHHTGNGCQRLYRNIHYNDFNQIDHQLDQTYVANDVWDINGVTYENSVTKYVNDELQQISHFMNDCETEQAIHRIRMIHGDKPKKVIIFNNVVLPTLQMDRLVTNLNVYYIQDYVHDNNFVVNKNQHLADVIGIDSKTIANLRSKSELIENIVADSELITNVIPIKRNGRRTSLSVIQRKDYQLTEDDLNQFNTGTRRIKFDTAA